MSESNVEVEVKFRVADFGPFDERVHAAGGKLKAARVYERNVRYENSENSLTAAGKVVRLRKDTRVRLTYKEPSGPARTGAKVSSRTELEVTVNDFDEMDLILGKLGYHPSWIYEKYRTTYSLAGVEIVFDEMPFGRFIEIEGEVAEIDHVAQTLQLENVPRITASYSELFDRLKERLQLTMKDLTFDAFRGLSIPESAWE